MELVKNIFFNTDKLVENSLVKISYTGKLFENNSEKVFVHYGFGNSWDNLNEVEMNKTELGFQAEIKIIGTDNLNLCFRSGENEWDNNDGKNYSFEVEEAPKELVVVDDEIVYPRKLRKTYLWSKKIKLAVYKLFRYFPKIITGNYTKKRNSETN